MKLIKGVFYCNLISVYKNVFSDLENKTATSVMPWLFSPNSNKLTEQNHSIF